MPHYDLAIIGGGINGAGIARDAAGRGLSVLLIEQHDLASATSSASTKLVHGGLRYLEYFEFRLVSEALAERETLLGIAPHIIWPLQFVLPHEPHLRPAWMIRAGLFLYDHLGRGSHALRGGRSSLPHSSAVTLAPDGLGAGLKPQFRRGFSYYDCWVDDARLVVLNARSAAERGAVIRTRTRLASARREAEGWVLQLEDARGSSTATARVLVNATGPWAQSLLEHEIGLPPEGRLRLVRGSHIVVPRVHEKSHAFILQNPDRRIVFMIPYEREFTLIGTTDVPQEQGAASGHAQASEEEIAYLCQAASRYSEHPVSPAQVVWSYSGVRALYDDGSANPSAVTRDYHLLVDAGADGKAAPVLSVFGGKITTYRRLAEEALARLALWFPNTRAWTHSEPLPGGDFRTFPALLAELGSGRDLPPVLLARLARRHGTWARRILRKVKREADLGEHYGGNLYEAELRYLIREEWAVEAEDVLWRRTKCGLHMSEVQRLRVAEAMQALT